MSGGTDFDPYCPSLLFETQIELNQIYKKWLIVENWVHGRKIKWPISLISVSSAETFTMCYIIN